MYWSISDPSWSTKSLLLIDNLAEFAYDRRAL